MLPFISFIFTSSSAMMSRCSFSFLSSSSDVVPDDSEYECGDPHQTVADSGKGNNSGRSTLLKQRPTACPDHGNDTPRLMLKRIIRTQPQVSPLVPQISQHEAAEEAQPELPSKRPSSMGELQLPNLVPESTSVATFHMTKKRKKLSISEFERAADRRLPQNQAQSTLDNTILARSLRMSLGSLVLPDSVEKRGLLRRPKNHKPIDMEAFEGGVEQNMLNRKAENYLVDSPTASGIGTAMQTSDAEIMLSNTELFVQPQFEQNQNKLSALELQLSNSKTSAQRSEISAAQEEARPVGLVSSVGTNEGRTEEYSEKDLILDRVHVDRTTHVSPKPPANQQEDKQDHSQQSNPMEQLFDSEEVVVGAAEHLENTGYSEHLKKKLTEKAESQITTAQDARVETEMALSEDDGIAEGSVGHQGSPEAEHDITRDVEAESLGRHFHAISSPEKSGMKLLKAAVEQADEDQAVMAEWDDPEKEPTEDEAEDPESEEVSMKTPVFVHAAADKPVLSIPCSAKPAALKGATPCSAKPATPKGTTPRSAKCAAPKSPLQPLRAKPVRRKTSEAEVSSSLIKQIFSHYVKMPVARDAYKIVEKCSQRYFKQLSDDLEVYSSHAGRKTVEMADLEILMRRQGLVTDKMPLHVLIERYLPLEYRKLLIPVAVSGNKVIPCK
ncbi:centromere protein T isoform B [Patagioenas fasciata monilis]|uniref:Centromere protein T n=1 Tax=Patagioenas fasciata monilis TaxID=372326 RepID=A0A1V4K0Z5_PATFA|nr:centromere protein T isoform B [Patagioenas fasciata monilis]